MNLSTAKKFSCFLAFVGTVLAMLVFPLHSAVNSVRDTVRMEFEEARCVDANGKTIGITKVADSHASGGYYAGSTGGKGFVFHNVPLSNRICIGYAGGFTAYLTVYLEENGTFREIGQVNYVQTSGWGMDVRSIASSDLLNIPEGSTVKLVPAVDVNLDYAEFDAVTWYQESDLPANTVPAIKGERRQTEIQEDFLAYLGKAVCLSQKGSSVAVSAVSSKDKCNLIHLRYRSQEEALVEIAIQGETALQTKILPSYGGVYAEIGLRVPDYQTADQIAITILDGGPLWLDTVTFRYFADAETVYVPRLPQSGVTRTEIKLDGIWECDTSLFQQYADLPDSVPELAFENTIPVPGMWDLASLSLGSYDRMALWYRKTVVLEEVPATNAVLRINRAYYGRYIYINGTLVGEYQYNYTNSYTDITKYLKQGENEIVIMLGSRLEQEDDKRRQAHVGLDGERKNYYPGLVDSVSLLFYRMPAVKSVQTAADLENGVVVVQNTLENTSDFPITTDITYRVYELGVLVNGQAQQERKLAGSITISGIAVPAGGTVTPDVARISLDDFDSAKYWSPDHPYLYEIEVQTSGDTYTTRFGMRTFYFDPDTKLPMLNGKVHYLLGTNLAVNRFYDDPNREDYAWQEQWVRQLYQEIKETNWDSFRFHLGSAPAFWYDLADEMGLLIMDEYAWWWCWCGCTAETLEPEIMAWIDEKSNHPSLIIWDMQNEDANTTVTGEVIQRLRGYDLQNRPWDNGWGGPQADTDPMECHPYLLSHVYFLRDLNNQSPSYSNPASHVPDGMGANNPKINNEYSSIWLNRFGEPSDASQKLYYDIVTPGGTNADRIAHYAMACGQVTEFWRSGRHFAGLLHFNALCFSRPMEGGTTGDILMPDISTPRFHPEIKESFRNAFAPIGVILGDWSDSCQRGETRDLPVILVNDTNEDVTGLDVRLVIYNGDRTQVVYEKQLTYDLKAAGDANGGDLVRQDISLTVPGADTDQYIVEAQYTRNGETVTSQRVWQITGGAISQPKGGLHPAVWAGVALGVAALVAGFVLVAWKKRKNG